MNVNADAAARSPADLLPDRPPPMEREAADTLAGIFKALGDPTRVAIVNRLAATDSVCVCDLNAAFDLSQPTISHHLRILRDAGLVEAERRGTWAHYRLVPDAIARCAACSPPREPPPLRAPRR